MKKHLLSIQIVYIFLFICGSAYGIGEKTVTLGGESGWKTAELRSGVTEAVLIRPNPVLILSSATGKTTAGYFAAAGISGNYSGLKESALDMSFSFDEKEPGLFKDTAGNYKKTVLPGVEAVDRRYSRAGAGAALFGGNEKTDTDSFLIEPDSRNALFSAGNRIGDFTLEFWLYPFNLENGEQILSWVSSVSPITVNGKYVIQKINCVALKNRLHWSFLNFFTLSNGTSGSSSHINIELSGDSPVVPKTWSHHLVRFDSSTGLIEYIVDGSSEAIMYATKTGRENNEVYTPIAGYSGVFTLGGHFTGLMDEFKIYNAFAERSSIQKYPSSGGRIETNAIDLGKNSGAVVKIEASGGITGIGDTKTKNEFRRNGRFRFANDCEMQFFIRSSDNPYRLSDSAWTSFTPGTEMANNIHGRFVQLAVDFYPSSDGETSPYLDEVKIIYIPYEPPIPPRNLTVSAVDGAVILRWKNSLDSSTAGYLVYYSSVSGEFFGKESLLGPSPIDAGKRNSIVIDGLKNGTLYYFRVAAYDNAGASSIRNTGEFSKEITARPLAGLFFESPSAFESSLKAPED
jgi:hypothetical protein